MLSGENKYHISATSSTFIFAIYELFTSPDADVMHATGRSSCVRIGRCELAIRGAGSVVDLLGCAYRQTATETVRTLIAYGYSIEAPTLEAES